MEVTEPKDISFFEKGSPAVGVFGYYGVHVAVDIELDVTLAFEEVGVEV